MPLPLSLAQLAVPDSLPTGWEYQGCYTDVAGRTIGAAGFAGADMTNEACIAFCSARGHQYAGTEYSQECFCGSSLAAGAAEVAATECNMACAGDSTQPCGAGGRLTLFHTSASVGPVPNPGANGFTHLGCYSEGTTGRTLTHGVGSIPNADMTVDLCTAACHTAGFILAGLEYGGECCEFPAVQRSRGGLADVEMQSVAMQSPTAAPRLPGAPCSAMATAPRSAADPAV